MTTIQKRGKTEARTKKHNCDMMFCCERVKLQKIHFCRHYIFFYFETRKDSEGYMIPFYAVVQKVCCLCDEKPFVKTYEHFLPHPEDHRCDISVEPVSCCGYRQYVFERNNACITKEFIDFMYVQPKNSVWIAHNGGRFDTVFLLRELLVERKIVPQCVMNGNKIMCMELEDLNLRVIDSYLFLNMSLSKFPEALGIPDLAKGYHPYSFYDLTYVGAMVGLEFFDLLPEASEERKQFDVWYTKQTQRVYNFKEAIYYYCRLDVDILRQGCIIFSRLIKNVTNVFPFYDK